MKYELAKYNDIETIAIDKKGNLVVVQDFQKGKIKTLTFMQKMRLICIIL